MTKRVIPEFKIRKPSCSNIHYTPGTPTILVLINEQVSSSSWRQTKDCLPTSLQLDHITLQPKIRKIGAREAGKISSVADIVCNCKATDVLSMRGQRENNAHGCPGEKAI